ncbi:Uncharacterised protein [Providencia rustigianii]|nr:Uncharacterised protein [Providencia rustigianii]
MPIGNTALSNNRLVNPPSDPRKIADTSEIASQIASVHTTQNERVFPISEEMNNMISIAGDRNKLHQHNHIEQSLNIHKLLKSRHPEITRNMILSVICAGASGNLAQQEINYRPENNLVLLTLLKPEELSGISSLLDSAADLITTLYKMGEKNSHAKRVLSHEEKVFDKKIESALLKLGQGKLQVLAQRYQQQYVDPSIKQVLETYFSQDEIASHPIDSFLVSSLNYGCEQRAAGAIREYEQHKREAFVDKACQIHNMFLSLEEKIETIRPLKIKMDLGEPKAPSLPVSAPEEDTVDGRQYFPASAPKESLLPATTTHNENMYNTYNTSNYYTSPQEITSINNVKSAEVTSEKTVIEKVLVEKDSIEKAGLPSSFRSVLNVELCAPVVKSPARFTTTLDVPIIRHIQEVVTEAPTLVEEKQLGGSFANKYVRVSMNDPATGKVRHSWQLSGKETKPVTLSERGALTRDSSLQEAYSQNTDVKIQTQNTVFANRFEAVEVEDEVTGQIKKTWQLAETKTSKPVTLTEMGALTRDQVAKEKYDDNGKHFS